MQPSNLSPEIQALIEEAKRVAAENDTNGTWVTSEELRARLAAKGVIIPPATPPPPIKTAAGLG
jgi:TRAP-type C4-dicarboxylate transport system substrate-binding protein